MQEYQAHLHNARGVFAGRAVELVLFQVGHSKQAALLTHVHTVCITLVEQPLLRAQTHAPRHSPTQHMEMQIHYH
jgi:hypothetical protein